MKTEKFITLISFILIVFYGEAQQNDIFLINGEIINQNKLPIADAYIYNLSSQSHTHSSSNGLFKLPNCHLGDTIQVGILGYKTQKFTLVKEDAYKKHTITLEEKTVQLDELVIGKIKNPLNSIVAIDLQTTPVNNSQEIMRKVPGLIIGQHAGGGKAEQIFLRGFDVDHGTDVSLKVDGMPVNMVSHAHGQGYSDLHFLIPETIQKIEFGKGPYYANQGDFNTAGYADFSTKNSIDKNNISVSFGYFNTLRTLGMFNLTESSKKNSAYMAIEYIESDGPFESPQNFNRINLFAKYRAILENSDQIILTASHFTSDWDASGQIPQREVDNGNITRFGAIDDTEGGETSRSNFNIQLLKTLKDGGGLTANAYVSNYNFDLFSNFTFFLEDPVNGDQIRQIEQRNIYGFNTNYSNKKYFGTTSIKYNHGIGIRFDDINNIELSKTKNRNERLQQIQLGDVNQTNFYTFFNASFNTGKFEISPGLRLDYFKFLYNNKLETNYQTLSKNKTIVNPKLNVTYNANDNLQVFIKSGIGFHSNDARVILQEDTRKLLPRAYGLDIGGVWKPSKKLILNSALWYLLSEEELVYVGDAGIIEPSGKSRRYGLDFGARYQLSPKIYFDSDLTLTTARSLEAISGEDYIPLAPDFTLTGGISFNDIQNFSGGLQFRYIDNRPANEDNSIIAEGYFVSDFNLNYSINNFTLGISIENVFDTEWNETQFATNSQLSNETVPVEEIHFTPGTPFNAKATITYKF